MQELKTAALFIRNVLEIKSDFFTLENTDYIAYINNHTFCSSQLPLSKINLQQSLLSAVRKNIFFLSDCAHLQWCFVITGNYLTLIGPYRTEHYSKRQLEKLAETLHLSSAQTDYFSSYYSSVPKVNSSYIKAAAVSIIEAFYQDTINIEISSIMLDSREMVVEDHTLPTVVSFVEKTHDLEEEYMNAVSSGNIKRAILALREISQRTHFPSPSISVNKLLITKSSVSIVRTEARLAARRVGVPSFVLNQISEKYRNLSLASNSEEEIIRLQTEMTIDVCNAVQQYKTYNYSTLVKKAVNYIHLHYQVPFSMKELAADIGISYNRLSKIFHQEVGSTLSSYILDARLEYATSLLLRTSYDIQRISSMVGIVDANYFSKLFRRKYAVTPSAFRKHPEKVTSLY